LSENHLKQANHNSSSNESLEQNESKSIEKKEKKKKRKKRKRISHISGYSGEATLGGFNFQPFDVPLTAKSSQQTCCRFQFGMKKEKKKNKK
jgi:hypothetical protein